MASLSIEQFSLDRFKTLHKDEIDARYRAFVKLSHWEDAAVV
jgi:hypothetical protein